MRKKLRTIVVLGQTYRWHRSHQHLPAPTGPPRCVEVVVIAPADRPNARLRLRFGDHAGWRIGYPSAGVLEYGSGPALALFNLNRPALIAALIAAALRLGWNPGQNTPPFELDDRFDLLPWPAAEPLDPDDGSSDRQHPFA